MAAGMSFVTTPAQAAFELPEGEKITNLPAIPRAIPQKEAYEIYDPKIGKNFDIKNFWVRADLRVRPELRQGVCFGAGGGASCNTFAAGTANASSGNAGHANNDQFIMQMTRLGIGYDVSPDVNFYMEIIQSSVWGANGTPGSTGADYDALNHNGATTAVNGNGGVLGVRAAYMLIRNFAGVQGLSVKAGRQYVSFGQQSLLGTFDWANTGFSHDGIMLQYSTKSFDSWLGAFRESESDLSQAAPTGGTAANLAPPNSATGVGQPNASADSNMLVFYNQIKSIPGFLIEPYYILYSNQNPSNNAGAAQTLGTPKSQNQIRHTIGNRIELRKGGIDATNELVYQFGEMGGTNSGQNTNSAAAGNQKDIHINAWATRNWLGYTLYANAWKPRLAVNLDYASGDGRANCTLQGAGTPGATGCKTANTFENLFPTNHIHMGYMDVQSWKNMFSPSANFQARPTKDDHIEFWYTNLNLANKNDNWYRGSQGVYVFSKVGNTKSHIGDELDIAWTHMFMDGKVAFQAAYGYLWSGGYIQQNLNTSTNQEWAYAQLWINF
jgi:hypothetical protein